MEDIPNEIMMPCIGAAILVYAYFSFRRELKQPPGKKDEVSLRYSWGLIAFGLMFLSTPVVRPILEHPFFNKDVEVVVHDDSIYDDITVEYLYPDSIDSQPCTSKE